jgi:ADP-ribose pyrophosphatase
MSEGERRVVWQGKHLEVVVDRGWEMVARRRITGIVCLVPLTPSGEIVLIEQERRPVGRRVIELPAGLVGDEPGQEDESLESAAARELEEETGYRAERVERLFDGVVSAGLSDESIAFYLASGCRRVGPGGGDGSEDITVHVVPLDEALGWIEARRRTCGVTADVKMLAALHFWAARMPGAG